MSNYQEDIQKRLKELYNLIQSNKNKLESHPNGDYLEGNIDVYWRITENSITNIVHIFAACSCQENNENIKS